MHGMFSPLLRVRSISPATLELLGKGAGRPGPIGTPFQIPECHSHRFVEAFHIPPMDYSFNTSHTLEQYSDSCEDYCHQSSCPGLVIGESPQADAEWGH